MNSPPSWNVLVTSQEGFERELRRFIKRHGTFRKSGFRNLLLGEVPDVLVFLDTFATELDVKPFARPWIGRVLPIHVQYPVELETFCPDTESHLSALSPQIAGRSFHVRVERRGHKGVMNTRDLELRFGEFLWSLLNKDGRSPVISFADPEVVVAIEVVGAVAGIALVERALRHQYTFVKID